MSFLEDFPSLTPVKGQGSPAEPALAPLTGYPTCFVVSQFNGSGYISSSSSSFSSAASTRRVKMNWHFKRQHEERVQSSPHPK